VKSRILEGLESPTARISTLTPWCAEPNGGTPDQPGRPPLFPAIQRGAYPHESGVVAAKQRRKTEPFK